MTHRNVPLTPEGHLRLMRRCQHRPIAHIAAEAGVSRQCLGKWVASYRENGEACHQDRSSASTHRPTQTPTAVVEQIARAVLGETSTAGPKAKSGVVEVIRTLRVTRTSAVKARTAVFNTLRA